MYTYQDHCSFCNKHFGRKLSKAYCSAECRKKALEELKKVKFPYAYRKCKNCNKDFVTNPAYITRRKSAGIFCTRLCMDTYIKNNKTAVVGTDGYVHVGKDRQHRQIVEKALGRKLLKREYIHHINGIKTDNRIENLQVVSPREHGLIHALEKNRLGKIIKCKCCNKDFYCISSLSDKRLFCSRNCYLSRKTTTSFSKART